MFPDAGLYHVKHTHLISKKFTIISICQDYAMLDLIIAKITKKLIKSDGLRKYTFLIQQWGPYEFKSLEIINKYLYFN